MHNAVLFSKMDETIVEGKKGMHIMTFSPQPYHLTLTSVIQKCINLNCKTLVGFLWGQISMQFKTVYNGHFNKTSLKLVF